MVAKENIRAKQYARAYIKNKMNGTKAIKETHNPKDDVVARSMASEYLAKPYVQKAIVDEMERQGLDDGKVSKVLKRNLTQKKHLPSSNTALDMYFKLTGSYAPEKKSSVNVNITDPKQFKEELQSIMGEIESLEG